MTDEILWKEVNLGILYHAPTGSGLEDYVSAIPSDAYLVRSQWILLKEFIDNGQAEWEENEVLVSHSEISKLKANECDLLGLPEFYPYDILIESRGTLAQSDFQFRYRFMLPNGKNI